MARHLIVGVRLTAASALPLTLGGLLGAHLAHARGIGVSRTPSTGGFPTGRRSISSPVPVNGWSEADLRGLPVLARLRQGLATVFAATCTHCGARLLPAGGDALRCPSDGRAFSVDDGAVLEGPAATPIPRVEVRPLAGNGVEVRSPPVG